MTPGDRRDELRRFKELDLRAYAADLGFELDRRKSGRRSAVMRHADGTKLLISRDADGHWVFVDLGDPAVRGTIVDLCQARVGGTLGDVRRALRPLLGGGAGPAPREATARFPSLAARDRADDPEALSAAYARTRPCGGTHPFLESRGVPPATLADPAFAAAVRIDPRGNAVFPHRDRGGVCGWELKNRDFRGFNPGGRKGLWVSRPRPDDDRLVVAESGLDALSYAALFGTAGGRFVSLAGRPGGVQLDLFAGACRKLSSGGTVVLAVDADDAGAALADLLEEVARDAGRQVRVHAPERPGDDWNDVLLRRGTVYEAPTP